MTETREIAAAGLSFRARISGPDDGEPVLMLHGFPQSSRMWEVPAATLAAAGYRTIAPDQRGYSPGARPAEQSAYTMATLTADAVAILDALDIPQAHVVGHDWGGVIAWNLGGRHADRVRTLSVVSTPHPVAFARAMRDPSTDQAERSAYMFFFRREPPEPENRLLDDDAAGLRELFRNSGLAEHDDYVALLSEPGAMTAALNWYRTSSIRDADGLAPIHVPTLYVWGTEDAALGRVAAEATGQYVEGPYRFEVLDGAGHWIAETHGQRLGALLLEHLRG